jgi:hypothetical protein
LKQTRVNIKHNKLHFMRTVSSRIIENQTYYSTSRAQSQEISCKNPRVGV